MKKKTLKNAVMKIRQESTEDTARMLELGMALGSLKMWEKKWTQAAKDRTKRRDSGKRKREESEGPVQEQ